MIIAAYCIPDQLILCCLWYPVILSVPKYTLITIKLDTSSNQYLDRGVELTIFSTQSIHGLGIAFLVVTALGASLTNFGSEYLQLPLHCFGGPLRVSWRRFLTLSTTLTPLHLVHINLISSWIWVGGRPWDHDQLFDPLHHHSTFAMATTLDETREGGLPLNQFTKNCPPGWRPGQPKYPIQLYIQLDRLL